MCGSSPHMTKRSLDLFFRINAPQLGLLDPAVKALAGNLTPGSGAVLDRTEHADLQSRPHGARSVRLVVERRKVGLVLQLHGRHPLSRQQRVVDPAFRADGVADAAPVLELGGNLNRPADAGIDPDYIVVLVRSAAHRDAVGLEADEARNRKPA